MSHIDAHHHFWHPARGDYGWMPADDEVLSRPYAPADLSASLAATSVTRTVLVQAAPSVEETEYLLGIADSTPHVAAVVGWINFEDPSQLPTLQRLAAHPKFVGVRPMIQDLPDDGWMLRDDVQWAYKALIDLDLTFDCLGFPRHLHNFHQLLTRYPELRAVIDHCMKPQVNGAGDDSSIAQSPNTQSPNTKSDNTQSANTQSISTQSISKKSNNTEQFNQWADGMSRLAEDTGACCKLSGLVTEAESDWSLEALKPYVDHVIDAFGAERIMWGSDWPVSRLRCEYHDWFSLAQQLTDNLSNAEREQIFSRCAEQFYRLSS